MSFNHVLRRSGDIMLLTGLGLCTMAIILMIAGPVHAQQGRREILREQVNPNADSEDPWLGGDWQFGAFGQIESNPYRGADSTDLGGLPLLAYDAERMHIGIDGIDIKAWQNDFASLSVIGGFRDGPFESGDSNYLRGMKDTDMGYDVGIGFSTRLWRGELILSLIHI